jgi:hypothetical protein
MIGRNDWPFSFMKQFQQPGTRTTGQYGIAQNRGSTPEALREIISRFEPVSEISTLVDFEILIDV